MRSGFTLFVSHEGLSYKEVKSPSVKSGFQKAFLEHLQPLTELVAFRELPVGR